MTFTMRLSYYDFVGIRVRSAFLCPVDSPMMTSVTASPCALHAESFFLTDTFGNQLVADYSLHSLQTLSATAVVSDLLAPRLVGVYLTSPLLTLYFSDAINVSHSATPAALSKFFFLSKTGGKYPLATLGSVAVSAVVLTNTTYSNQLLINLTPILSQLKAGGVAQV